MYMRPLWRLRLHTSSTDKSADRSLCSGDPCTLGCVGTCALALGAYLLHTRKGALA